MSDRSDYRDRSDTWSKNPWRRYGEDFDDYQGIEDSSGHYQQFESDDKFQRRAHEFREMQRRGMRSNEHGHNEREDRRHRGQNMHSHEQWGWDREHIFKDSHRGKGPRSYQRKDDRIREDVNERLTDDPIVDAMEIEVDVQNGEVTLTGTVDHKLAKRRSEDIVETISGVKHVENRLRVRQRM